MVASMTISLKPMDCSQEIKQWCPQYYFMQRFMNKLMVISEKENIGDDTSKCNYLYNGKCVYQSWNNDLYSSALL